MLDGLSQTFSVFSIGLCRQEKYGFQSLWDRAKDAKDILCSALLLSEAGKGAGRKDKVSMEEASIKTQGMENWYRHIKWNLTLAC